MAIGAVAGGLVVLAALVALVHDAPYAVRKAAWGLLTQASPVRVHEQALLVVALASAVVLLVAGLRSAGRALPRTIYRLLVAMAFACGVLATARHALGRDHYFDVGDNFHYYLGAKYARELRYDRHYECVGAALEEAKLPVPARYRDLRNNRTRTWAQAGPRARAHCPEAFEPARWASFRGDVVEFASYQSFRALERRFRDHGYNGTPIWSTVAGTLADAVPVSVRNQTWVAVINHGVLATSLGLVIAAFGWELGLLYGLLFWVQYADRFLLGGAFLRYLPLSLVLAGSVALKLQRPVIAGACVGLAAGLLIFPGLLLAAAGLYLALGWARLRPPSEHDALAWRFVLAGGCVLLSWFLLSLLASGGLDAWAAFLEKMRLNSTRLATGRIGFLFNFLWPKPFATDPHSYDAALATLHAPQLLGVTLNHLRYLLGATLIAALAHAYRKAHVLTFMLVVGFALFFVCFPTVRYYYMGFVALPLVVHAAPASRSARWWLAGLFALCAGCHALDRVASHAFLHNTLLSMGLTAALLVLCVPAVARELSTPERSPA